MRAASRPGSAATRLAKTSAPSTTRITDKTGTVGSGTALRLRANSVHSYSPSDDPDRHPHDDADHCGHRRLPSDRGPQLSRGETERLQQGQVPSAPADRCREGEAEGDDRPSGKADGEDDRGGADAAVVHDLGGTLNTEDGDVVADRIGVRRRRSLSRRWRCVAGSARPAAGLTPLRSRTKTSSGPFRFGSWR